MKTLKRIPAKLPSPLPYFLYLGDFSSLPEPPRRDSGQESDRPQQGLRFSPHRVAVDHHADLDDLGHAALRALGIGAAEVRFDVVHQRAQLPRIFIAAAERDVAHEVAVLALAPDLARDLP